MAIIELNVKVEDLARLFLPGIEAYVSNSTLATPNGVRFHVEVPDDFVPPRCEEGTLLTSKFQGPRLDGYSVAGVLFRSVDGNDVPREIR